MTIAKTNPFRPLRLIALTAAMVCSAAHADDYSDVSQLVRAGKLAEALTKADQYLAGKPRDPQMRFLKGVIQRDAGKTGDAIGTFTRLTEDYPELPEPYNNLAVLYASQSQFDKARTALEMAIRTNPSYATAHENLGDIYAKLASQAYNKALQLDATNQAVPPKLALIRELFSAGGKAPRPTVSATPVATPAMPAATPLPTPAATPAQAAAKPAPTLPAPATAKPAVAVAPAPVASTPVAAAAPAPAPAPVVTPPPAATATPVPAPASAGQSASGKEAEATVKAWAKAWAARDVKNYLAYYGRDFDPPGSMKRSEWEEERRQRISSKANISVNLEDLTVTVEGSKAVAKFRQNYKAGGLAVSSRKTLDLVKSGDRWHIVREAVN